MAQEERVWLSSPSFPLSIIGAIVYAIPFLIIFYQTIIQYRAWFFTCVVFGAAMEVAGYAARSYSAKFQYEVAPFAIQSTFIVIAPVFIAAGNYLLIGRLIRAVLPPTHHRIFRVPARLLTRIFVAFDVLSCLIQASGSGIASSNDWEGSTVETGTNVLIGGLSLQVATFTVYMCIFSRFHWLANRMEVEDTPAGWRKVILAVYVSSSLILVRSVYRVIEFAQGIHGYAFTHEWIFWVFEAIPMLIAISIFCLYHPSRFLGRRGGMQHVELAAKREQDSSASSERRQDGGVLEV
ncbi:RTA1-domain-containing protein [Eremomyces bilateralis CBS 781.70]|uniref:RTA1-domain-containing protein n=1 Tax=Eremomyces bilateralis CBS 781.70 TaxID=1392243 RepID=A0A6G1G2I8_9PEZI|nr:RTA1-domain-containing protein [Eremomyces bilateralis CBS 781.70]KAF1812327.1 RTA1-domain-containing protein [Eremomyces bilateralis CBS 781.70]